MPNTRLLTGLLVVALSSAAAAVFVVSNQTPGASSANLRPHAGEGRSAGLTAPAFAAGSTTAGAILATDASAEAQLPAGFDNHPHARPARKPSAPSDWERHEGLVWERVLGASRDRDGWVRERGQLDESGRYRADYASLQLNPSLKPLAEHDVLMLDALADAHAPRILEAATRAGEVLDSVLQLLWARDAYLRAPVSDKDAFTRNVNQRAEELMGDGAFSFAHSLLVGGWGVSFEVNSNEHPAFHTAMLDLESVRAECDAELARLIAGL
ncbi:MAG: hypothetical protein GY711_14815 [bacterium]|nr:hypothetical protein [bacterium]